MISDIEDHLESHDVMHDVSPATPPDMFPATPPAVFPATPPAVSHMSHEISHDEFHDESHDVSHHSSSLTVVGGGSGH